MTTSTLTTSTLSRIGIPTGTWKVDKANSRVGFAVKSLGFTTVRGEFREFVGALEIGEDLADTRAYGRVDAASVDTGLARRDAHLRSKDFLSAEGHPELSFRSKALEPVDDHAFRLIGDLSINGVTNEVELSAELLIAYVAPVGFTRVLFGAHFPLDVVVGAALGYELGLFSVDLIANARLLPQRRRRKTIEPTPELAALHTPPVQAK
jgi:polyisoprenoid-binding protein YceI